MHIDTSRSRPYSLREQTTRATFGVFLAVLGNLPPAIRHRIGILLGWVNWCFSTRMAQVTRENLRRCFPDWSDDVLRRQVRSSLIDTGKVAVETSRIWYGPVGGWHASILKVVGEERIRKAQQAGKGVILLAPHFGNWELLNAYLGERYSISCLYQPPKIKALQPLLKRCRERTGSRLFESDRQGIRCLLEALKRGEVIGVLPDQVPGLTGWVESSFFGNPVLNMTLPCELAERTDAVVLLGVARRVGPDGFVLSFLALPDSDQGDPDQNPETVCATRINRAIEAVIRPSPSQYQWEYKRFKVPRKVNVARTSA